MTGRLNFTIGESYEDIKPFLQEKRKKQDMSQFICQAVREKMEREKNPVKMTDFIARERRQPDIKEFIPQFEWFATKTEYDIVKMFSREDIAKMRSYAIYFKLLMDQALGIREQQQGTNSTESKYKFLNSP